MKIIVLLRMVPDVVEELEIAASGKALDEDALRMVLSECDEHALEQALLIKERSGAEVIAVAPESAEVDECLFAAMAKGADRAFKIACETPLPGAMESARLLEAALRRDPELLPADLILTGVQASGDLDALLAPVLAERLGLPFLGVVTRLQVDDAGRKARLVREFSGGVRGEYEIALPAVIGIQAAEKPPRYVPVAKVRTAMKTRHIDLLPAPEQLDAWPGIEVLSMSKPEAGAQALMFSGTPEQAVDALALALNARGLL